MWDTVSFSGATAGKIGTLILSAPSYGSGNTSGSGYIYVDSALSGSGFQRVESDFNILQGTDSLITVSIKFPLDIGPMQFAEEVNVGASASKLGYGGPIYLSSAVTFDPGWTFVLPAGVSLNSASGAVYPTSPVPIPGAILLFGPGLVGLNGPALSISPAFTITITTVVSKEETSK
jgi:hypothetical protein